MKNLTDLIGDGGKESLFNPFKSISTYFLKKTISG